MKDLNKLSEYLNNFLIGGINLFSAPDSVNKFSEKRLLFEKSLVCGSFWSISALTILSEPISQSNLISLLKLLNSCFTNINTFSYTSVNSNSSHSSVVTNTEFGPVLKAFMEYNNNLYSDNIQSTLYAIEINYLLRNFPLYKQSQSGIDHLLLTSSDLIPIINYIKSLYNPEGYFFNHFKPSNEYSIPHYTDLRSTMSALCAFTLALKLLNYYETQITDELNKSFDLDRIYKFLRSHFNSDGGISLSKNAQSHVAGAFCCIGSLVLIERINSISHKRIKLLISWLLERMSINGGINGRVGKSNDICYIWWCLSTLFLLVKYYDKPVKLFNQTVIARISRFVEQSQNSDGGFSANKSHENSDPYHSFTALLSIALLNQFHNKYNIHEIEPLFAIPINPTHSTQLIH
ncbi:type ii proteins geranylgeranyltransferase beta subunit, putative [Theileria annulata]|uniref:Geranylgeranyl transferase type II subunit beta n=1 Tax=Theileria annulata TaxID=5874 RepID=Q4UGC3_THEAN|nr:type ii proteins geranylgeranyltransferase beta subunit, putative [Theileria annulata]CAI73866.1 type ii proteins geranylgeranyltransferase beta subunit, putative [Theileria annulata]|eukprot:XP_954543.1 type ii proteins geranylgeranyltransferase beta subunit, putative [Theileria annulata]